MPSDATEPLSVDALRTPPTNLNHVPAPVLTTLQQLPWEGYDWKNFERLCLRLLEAEYDLEDVRLHGKGGEDQHGIDLLGKRRDKPGFVVLQAKRVKDFTASDLKKVGAEFLHVDAKTGAALERLKDEDGDDLPLPRDLADTFILAATTRLDGAKQTLAWSKLQKDLGALGISSVQWDHAGIERRLKKHPQIVQDFFGNAHVAAFCGEHEAAKLGGTVGQADMQGFREDLQAVLSSLNDLKTGETALSGTRDRLARIENQLTALRPAVTVSESPVDSPDAAEQALNTVRTLLEAGAGAPALEALDRLEAGPHPLTQAQQATAHRLRGHVHYRQGNPETAAPHFHQAFALDPPAPANRIVEGLAWLITGEPARAVGYLDLARREHPERSDARSLYVLATAMLGRTDELAALEAQITADDDAVAINLARHYANKQDTAAVRRVLARLDGGPHEHDPHRLLLNCKADLLDLMADLEGRAPEWRARVLKDRPEVRGLLATISEILPALKDPRMNRGLTPEALNIAQVIHSLLGEEEAALEQGRAALAVDPTEHGIRVDVALSCLRLGRPADAVRELRAGGEPLLTAYPESRGVLSAALRQTGLLDDALAVIAPLLQGSPSIGGLDEQVRILLAQGKVPEARLALAGAPDVMQVHLLQAEVEQAAQDDPATRQAFEAALRAAPEPAAPHARMLFAQYLGTQGAFADAVALLRPMDLTQLPSAWLDVALALAYQGNGPVDAILAELTSRGDLTDLSSLHVAMMVAASQGDFTQAIQRGEAFLRKNPKEPHVTLTLADLYVRIRQLRSARRLLEQLAVGTLSSQLLVYASRIARRLGEGRLARDLSYQAYRRAGSEDAHLEFLQVMLGSPDEPAPAAVQPETAVHLTHEGRPEGWWAVLTHDPQPDRVKGEYALSEAFARGLLGKRPGDKVHEGGEEWTVSEVLSKYAYAAKHVLGHARQLFPTSSRMRQFTTGPFEVLPAGLWDMLRARHDDVERVLHAVREGQSPVMALHPVRPGPETSFWEMMTAGRVEMVTEPHRAVFDQAARRIVTGKALFLDPSALVVLNRARLLRQLPKTHQVLVTRQTLDDVRAAVMEVEQELKRAPLKSLHYEGGRVVFVEEDIAVTRRRLHFFKGIESFVRKQTRIVPVVGMGGAAEALESVSPASLSTAVGAFESDLPMLSDDLVWMTIVGQRTPLAPWTTSAAFTRLMGEEGRWSADRVQQALLTFLDLGQTVLPLPPGAVREVLKREDLSFGHLSRRVVRTVTHPWQSAGAAADGLTQFIRMACILAPLEITRDRWIRQALDAAAADRDALTLARDVAARLPRAFHLLQDRLPDVLSTMEDWLQLRLHPQGLLEP